MISFTTIFQYIFYFEYAHYSCIFLFWQGEFLFTFSVQDFFYSKNAHYFCLFMIFNERCYVVN